MAGTRYPSGTGTQISVPKASSSIGSEQLTHIDASGEHMREDTVIGDRVNAMMLERRPSTGMAESLRAEEVHGQ